MPKATVSLTNRFAATAKPPAGAKDVAFFDARLRGFALRAYATGNKTWMLQFTSPHDGRERKLGLGPWPAVDADAARAAAEAAVAQIAKGVCPWQEQQARKAGRAVRAVMTLGAVRDDYIARYVQVYLKPGRSQTECKRVLTAALEPLADTYIGSVDRAMLQRRFGEIAVKLPSGRGGKDAARIAAAYTHALLSWAVTEGVIERNPLVSSGQKKAAAKRDRVLSNEELVRVWNAVEDCSAPAAYRDIVRLLTLTGCRRDEIATLEWTEVDFEKKAFTVTAAKSKSGVARVVPLGTLGWSILSRRYEQRLAGPFVFGDRRDGFRPFSGFSRAKTQLDEAVGEMPPWVLHDLRRTAVSRADELTRDAAGIEDWVGHISGTRAGVQGIYNRSDRSDRVRAIAEAVDNHVANLLAKAAAKTTEAPNVVMMMTTTADRKM